MLTIRESDWKILRDLKPVLLERYCQQALLSAEEIMENQSRTFHQRYLDLYALIEQRDKALALAFDDFKRSDAISRMASLRVGGLLMDEEYGRFSMQTRELVDRLAEAYAR